MNTQTQTIVETARTTETVKTQDSIKDSGRVRVGNGLLRY